MSRCPWSPAEDGELRKLAMSGLSLAELATRLDREKSSVRSRALKINVAIARDRNPMKTVGHKVKSNEKPSRVSARAGLRLGLKAKSKG